MCGAFGIFWGIQSPPKLPSPPRVQGANGEFMGLNSANEFLNLGLTLGILLGEVPEGPRAERKGHGRV